MYINDAFSCSHRKQASVHALPSLFRESYAGPLFQREVDAIDSVISKNRHPVTCIIGGSKISTKIGVILNLVKKLIISLLSEQWQITSYVTKDLI